MQLSDLATELHVKASLLGAVAGSGDRDHFTSLLADARHAKATCANGWNALLGHRAEGSNGRNVENAVNVLAQQR
jgi:hypothetical protein